MRPDCGQLDSLNIAQCFTLFAAMECLYYCWDQSKTLKIVICRVCQALYTPVSLSVPYDHYRVIYFSTRAR